MGLRDIESLDLITNLASRKAGIQTWDKALGLPRVQGISAFQTEPSQTQERQDALGSAATGASVVAQVLVLAVWLQRSVRVCRLGGNAGTAPGTGLGHPGKDGLPAHMLMVLCACARPTYHEHLGTFPCPSPPGFSNRRENRAQRTGMPWWTP